MAEFSRQQRIVDILFSYAYHPITLIGATAMNLPACAILLLVWVYSTPAFTEQMPGVLPNEQSYPNADSGMLSTTPKIFAKRFDITGNQVIPSNELATIVQPYANRELTTEQLEQLRQQLISLYLTKGYVNSGVIIPDQNVADGVIRLTVIEGRLTSLEIAGLQYYSKAYIGTLLGENSQAPLNVNRLQERLQLLQQDSRIKRINAELKPGEKPGEATLGVKIEEESPYKMTLRFHNDAAPSTGPYKGEVSLAHRNLLGFGDTLHADFGITEGAQDYAGSYTLPLASTDTAFSLYYRRSGSNVIEEQFEGLNIESISETFGLKIRQPLYRAMSGEFALSLTGELRRSQSKLLGRSFSFSPGEHDGAARVSVLRFGQEYLYRAPGYLFALNSTFNLGLSVGNATTNHNEPDSRFFSWLGQLILLSRIGQTPLQAMFKTNAQVAANSLLPLEKFGLGGMNSVRGYRNNQLVRDNGVNSSLELRMPVINDEKGWGVLQLVPFADFGWGWNTDLATPKPEVIGSVGAGFRWNFLERFNLEFYYGYGIERVSVSNKELADQGIHFQLIAEVF